ncbi:hypothetical protein RE628_22645 [Paenibacillus sp. D2_2]|uniref:hypothetical protein n=1 Tax=Paenibacillus sp. D2_2 TaxID=3073092 RepID=UPI002814DB49|nr:hypothetical protein [Paenibacillus sp. D2_2]WMT40081.1 hypothetical protein RE628_22645 [Paenibacillus sp. D2_2]
MKKKWSIAMATVLASVMLLSACSTGKTDNSSSNSASNKGNTESKGKVDLTFTIWGDVNSGSVEQTLADEFNASHPNINVKF